MNILALKNRILSETKILVIDDSNTSRSILETYCKSMGFIQIECACDGQEGLEKILTWKPSLVFMDMNMPIMNGLEVCKALKKQGMAGQMIIIMHTADNKPHFLVDAFNAGVTDFLAFPLNPHEMQARTMAHLERYFLRLKMDRDYKRICEELNNAAILQHILLPTERDLQRIQQVDGLDIAYHYQAAAELAGDYLSVSRLSENQVTLISVDVSGHGLLASIYAFSVHSLLSDIMKNTKEPGEILGLLNDKLRSVFPKGTFATIFLGIIDVDNKQLNYAAGGAPPPLF